MVDKNIVLQYYIKYKHHILLLVKRQNIKVNKQVQSCSKAQDVSSSNTKYQKSMNNLWGKYSCTV